MSDLQGRMARLRERVGAADAAELLRIGIAFAADYDAHPEPGGYLRAIGDVDQVEVVDWLLSRTDEELRRIAAFAREMDRSRHVDRN